MEAKLFPGADNAELGKRREKEQARLDSKKAKTIQGFENIDTWLTPKLLKLRKEWVKNYRTYYIENDAYVDTFSNSRDGSEEYAQFPLYYNGESILQKVATPAGRRVLRGLRKEDTGGPEGWDVFNMQEALQAVAELFYGGELPDPDEI